MHVKRFKANEVHVELDQEGEFQFPLAAGDWAQPELPIREQKQRRKRRRQKPAPAEEGQPSDSGNAEHPDIVAEADTWIMSGDTVIRKHDTPRTTLFVPQEADCPIPLKYIDILRTTETSISERAEAEIRDFWTAAGARTLSGPWTGRTVFYLLRPKPPPGKKWVEGRLTKIQATTRPDSVWPEIWSRMSKKNKQKEIDAWSKEGPARDEERKKRGIIHVPDAEVDDFNRIVADAKEKLAIPPAPAMPVVAYANAAIPMSSRQHQDKVLSVSEVHEEHYAMVHQPIPISKAMKIPAAKKAVDAEWDKLDRP